MVKTVVVSRKYKYVLDRVFYEVNMNTRNLAFMLNKNLNNPDFLKSDLYSRMTEDTIDAFLNKWVVLDVVYKTMGAPVFASMTYDDLTGDYSLNWMEDEQ